MPSLSVFVGGLSNDVSKEDLEREFGKFGSLNKVWVARNPPGFAFIEFEDDGDAHEAIKEMNGASINGSEIRVDVSHNSGGGGGRGGGGRGRRDGGFRGRRGGGGFGGRGRNDDRYGGYRGGGGGGGFRRGGRGGGGGDSYNRYDNDNRGGGGYRSRSPVADRDGDW